LFLVNLGQISALIGQMRILALAK